MAVSLAESYRFCADIARREAKNFRYGFLVLPADRRRAMNALYAFMRRTDDLSDEPGEPDAKRRALDAWRGDLENALAGRPDAWPGLPALADTVERFAVPPRHLNEVVDGCVRDLEPHAYETFEDLYEYCYLVASAVGLCCIRIWGFRSDAGRAESAAEACGVALQLTNILRDVKEDHARGRVYLPAEDLHRFGVSPEELAAERPSPALRRLLTFEAERAYDHFAAAAPLAQLVDPVGRPVLGAIAGIYRALLDEIVGRDYDVLSARVSLPAHRKLGIALGSLVRGRFAASPSWCGPATPRPLGEVTR